MTAQRELVITILSSSNQLLDAESLFQIAHQQDAEVSLATVYRTLNMLEEAGLVQQRYLSRDHERKVYEIVTTQGEYLFTCRSCHKVISFQSDIVQNLKAELDKQLGLEVTNICMCLDGLCPTCRATHSKEG